MTEPYRHFYEIMKDILEALPGHKTYIRCKTRDPVRYEEYFDYAIANELMYKGEIEKNKYYLSDKGRHYLEILNELLRLQGQ
jgi:predicted transcriptional regulator